MGFNWGRVLGLDERVVEASPHFSKEIKGKDNKNNPINSLKRPNESHLSLFCQPLSLPSHPTHF